jgi:hypothetical protein
MSNAPVGPATGHLADSNFQGGRTGPASHRSDPRTRMLPVVILTSSKEDQIRVNAY